MNSYLHRRALDLVRFIFLANLLLILECASYRIGLFELSLNTEHILSHILFVQTIHELKISLANKIQVLLVYITCKIFNFNNISLPNSFNFNRHCTILYKLSQIVSKRIYPVNKNKQYIILSLI